MYIRRRRRKIFILPKTKMKTIIFVLIALMLYCMTMALCFLRELSTDMAVSDAIDAVTLDVNSAINHRMTTEEMSYDRFVSLDKDEAGLVSAIKTNMAEINTLSSNMLSDIVGKGDMRIIELDIPLGNLMGSSILLSRGPDIPLDIIMLTSSRIDFRNEITTAGINQTKHKIIFEVTVEIDVILPWDIVKTEVITEVIVAETVIVGSVPETYVSLEGN